MRFKFILIAVAVTAIVACSSSGEVRRQKYLDADYYGRLEMPPNLTEPSTSQQLSIPKPTDAVMKKFKEDTKNVGKPGAKAASAESVLPPLKGVQLKTEAGMSWLEVDSTPQQLWPKLGKFWSEEGIPVVKSEPMLGIIETDWVSKLQAKPSDSWLKKLFNKAEPDRLDKFRMRVQADGAGKTRVYVSQSGMQEVEVQGNDYPSWRARPSEAGLEQEILSRLALYLGLDEQEAKAALANYGPYASHVISVVDFDPTANEPDSLSPNIYLNEGMDDAWLRTRRALDRLNATIIKSDAEKHEYDVSIAKLELPKGDDPVAEDETAKSSWLMKWFKGSDKKTAAESGSKYKIVLSDQGNHKVKLSIQKPGGEPVSGAQAAEFRRRLVQELQ
jgi:outer membrane protein assembly factor BamC